MTLVEFAQELEKLEALYEKLNDENKFKLEEAIQMVITKFNNRL